MTTQEATAEVFYQAYKALPKKERDLVITRMVEDKALRRDLLDLAVIREREGQPSRPLRDYLNERRGKS